jgi:hypothetical protein
LNSPDGGTAVRLLRALGLVGRAPVDRDAPRREALTTLLAAHAIELIDHPAGGLAIVRGGATLLHADTAAGTLRLPGASIGQRDDALEYDTITGQEYPAEPDLLLLQQAALVGVRLTATPSSGEGDEAGRWCSVSATGRLAWPAHEPAMSHPAVIDAEQDWQWPFDPLYTCGELAAAPPAWVTDYPPLLQLAELVRAPRDDRFEQACTRVEQGAAAAGLALEPLPGDAATWAVLREGSPRGLAELLAIGNDVRLDLSGAVVRTSVHRRQLGRAPWAETFDAPVAQPLHTVGAWEGPDRSGAG